MFYYSLIHASFFTIAMNYLNYLPPYLVQVTGEGNTCGETYIKIATSPTCERKKSRKGSFVTFYTVNLTSSSFYL